MKIFAACVVAWAFCISTGIAQDAFEQVTFDATDGVQIVADLYAAHENAEAPFIILCHQAGWSRGEYREIAPKLNALGFNCLAIDQRSGGSVNSVANQTFKNAKAADKATNFVDAESDMIDAINFVRENHAEGKVILWGSSYSSALSLRIAGEHPDKVDGVLAFAPGEYFGRFGKPADWIQTSVANIEAPVFVTSAKKEVRNWSAIFDAIPGEQKVKFVPTTAGNHGSRALWEEFADHGAYWESVEGFLTQFVEAEAEEDTKLLDAATAARIDKLLGEMNVQMTEIENKKTEIGTQLKKLRRNIYASEAKQKLWIQKRSLAEAEIESIKTKVSKLQEAIGQANLADDKSIELNGNTYSVEELNVKARELAARMRTAMVQLDQASTVIATFEDSVNLLVESGRHAGEMLDKLSAHKRLFLAKAESLRTIRDSAQFEKDQLGNIRLGEVLDEMADNIDELKRRLAREDELPVGGQIGN